MKAFKKFKKLTLTTMGIAGLAVMASGSYNTMLMQDDSFMSAASDIKFAKRLDEIQGKIVVGRMAASADWKSVDSLAKESPEKEKKEEKKRPQRQVGQEPQEQRAETPEPAIKADMDLTLTNVYFEKPLKQGEFSGSARTVDGVIEEIYVRLPEGHAIEINTRERMVGNVFQYEDFETREMKSGMLYEVKPGTYMVTLTNDSKYAGVRMEFKTEDSAQVRYSDEYYQRTQGWSMDEQEPAREAEAESEEQNYGYEYDYERGYDQEVPAQDEYEYQDNAEKEKGFHFNFQQ